MRIKLTESFCKHYFAECANFDQKERVHVDFVTINFFSKIQFAAFCRYVYSVLGDQYRWHHESFIRYTNGVYLVIMRASRELAQLF
jgi:hypothetical protein